MTRTATILATLDLGQPQLAGWLRVTQATVSRLVSGQTEPGPISKLLDQLEDVLSSLGPEAARELVLTGVVSPDRLAASAPADRPTHIMQSGFGSFS
jgi:predicted transcriptional regulator